MIKMIETNDVNGLLLVIFGLGGAWYGIEASQVQEVILVEENTVVYHAPAYVRGIINLRGKIVTVLDLEKKVGLASHEVGEDSRILIVEWNHEQVGLLVEVVTEVVNMNRDQIEPVPMNISDGLRYFLSGVCSIENRLVGIIDLDKAVAE
jgi:purine-binding chemotaxis protein CheW